MKLQIQSIHFDADQKLLDYIQEKCDKLDKFFDRITDGQVFLKLEKDSDSKSNKFVEIKLNLPGEVLVVKEQGIKFEEGTDLAVESLKRLVQRHKEKLKAH